MSNLYDNEFDAPLDLDLYGNPVIQSNLEPVAPIQNMSMRSPSSVPSDNPAEDEKRKVIQDYLQKKYDKAAVAADKPSNLVDDYTKAKDNSDVDKARENQRNLDIAAAIGEGLVGAFGSGTPGKAYMKGWGQTGAPEFTKSSMVQFDAQPIRDLGVRKVQDAQSNRKARIDDYLMRDKLGQEERNRAEADKNTNAESDRSRQATLLVKAQLVQLAKEASAAGDREGAEALMNQSRNLGNLSTNDALAMKNGLSGIDYKTALSIRSAEKRQKDEFDRSDAKENRYKQKLTNDLRREINGNHLYQKARSTEMTLSQVDELMKSPQTGATDQALIMMYNKALDPSSVVRESEFALTSSGGGLISRLESAYGSMITGERLTPEMRKDILGAMKAIKNGNQQFLYSHLRPYESAIVNQGLDRDSIFGKAQEPVSIEQPKSVKSPANATRASELP